jgi:tetratricopeptide (TPR) repeat protein
MKKNNLLYVFGILIPVLLVFKITSCALKDDDKVIPDCTKAIEIDPNLANTYYFRGKGYLLKGQYDRAISYFNKAIKINTMLYEAYHGRGLAYQKQSQYDLAIGDYCKAIQLDPNLVIAYNNRGSAYNWLGEKSCACEDWQKACNLGNCTALFFYKEESICKQ